MKKNSYLPIVAILSLIGAIASVAGATWLIYDWGAKRGALSELQFAYESAAQKNVYTASARALLRDIDPDRKKLQSITEVSDPVEIIRFIESAGKEAHVPIIVQAVSPGSPSSQDPQLHSLLVSMSAEGPFKDLYYFISLAETMPIPSAIEQVKLEKRENTWNMEMLIRVFIEEPVS